MANIADGVYNAKITAAAVYERNDCLKLEVNLELCDANGNVYTAEGTDGNECPVNRRAYYTLISREGSVNSGIVNQIKEWAPEWDGTDPFWFTETANTDAIGMVKVTLKTEPAWNDPSKAYQNVKWINALSGNRGSGRQSLQSGDKAAILAKYGAKFRAAAGSLPKPVSAASLTKPAAKPTPPPTPAPVKPAPKSSSPYQAGLDGQSKVWADFCNEHNGEDESELSERWFNALDKVAAGKDQADLTGDEWKAVADELGMMPF